MTVTTDDSRPSWDDYYTDLAEAAATRATCPRLSVGAVLVSPDHRVISTGYNGSVRGQPHCTEAGCLLNDQGRCVRTLHAEQNALLHARQSIEGATCYVTHEPCEVCTKLLRQAGVTRLSWARNYPNRYASLLRAGMVCVPGRGAAQTGDGGQA